MIVPINVNRCLWRNSTLDRDLGQIHYLFIFPRLLHVWPSRKVVRRVRFLG